MKKRIVLALALSFTAGTSFAAPTLYGEIDTSLDYLPEHNATQSNHDVWEVSSNSSYLGIKGEEKLTERLSAVYLAEWAFNSDGDGTDWTQRNRFVGLKDNVLGTLKLGKHDTPVKQLSTVVDTFNNYVGNKADIGGIFTGENRVDNVVVYESPAIKLASGDIKINALLATGEGSGVKSSSGGVKAAGGGLGDAWSASAVYDNKIVIAGIGYDKSIPSSFLGRGFLNASEPEISGGSLLAAADTIRAIGRVNLLNNSLALKALYQSSEVDKKSGNVTGTENIDDATGWLIGAEYNFPNAKKWTVKGQYSQNNTSYKTNTADFEAAQIMAGVDYAFSKQFRTYGYAGYLTLEQASNKDKQPVGGIGLEFKF